jgi:hypothetical protein
MATLTQELQQYANMVVVELLEIPREINTQEKAEIAITKASVIYEIYIEKNFPLSFEQFLNICSSLLDVKIQEIENKTQGCDCEICRVAKLADKAFKKYEGKLHTLTMRN